MYSRLAMFALIILLTASTATAASVANDKTNFSGQWIMSKAEGLPAGLQQRMKVEQDGDKIGIETDLFQGDNVQTIPDMYTLDGKEMEFDVRLPSGEETKAKRVAKWNDKGDGFEVRDVAVFETANGKVTITTVRKWAMSEDGKSLVINLDRTGSGTETHTIRTFNRK
jgi:hypothetical protein